MIPGYEASIPPGIRVSIYSIYEPINLDYLVQQYIYIEIERKAKRRSGEAAQQLCSVLTVLTVATVYEYVSHRPTVSQVSTVL
jgi:hypothetical protein